MLTLVRIVLGLAGLLAGWGLSYWLYFGQFDVAASPFLGRGAPFLVGVAVAAVILAATEHLQHGLLTAVVLGGLLFGGIGFLLDLFADAETGDASLLALMMSGPGGLLLGMPVGAGWWGFQRWRRAAA